MHSTASVTRRAVERGVVSKSNEERSGYSIALGSVDQRIAAQELARTLARLDTIFATSDDELMGVLDSMIQTADIDDLSATSLTNMRSLKYECPVFRFKFPRVTGLATYKERAEFALETCWMHLMRNNAVLFMQQLQMRFGTPNQVANINRLSIYASDRPRMKKISSMIDRVANLLATVAGRNEMSVGAASMSKELLMLMY